MIKIAFVFPGQGSQSVGMLDAWAGASVTSQRRAVSRCSGRGRGGNGGLLIWNRRHLENVLAAYVKHYNTARPHRGINLGVPVAHGEPTPATVAQI